MVKKTVIYSLMITLVFLLSMVSLQSPSIATSSNLQTKSNPNQSRTDQWIEDLQANYNNPSWFYTHLNDSERLEIREAMDYAIPRASIIRGILNGFAVPLATYTLPKQGQYALTNLTSRVFNLTASVKLLTQVFGYTYSITDNVSTPFDESAKYFPITIMVPNSNAERVQYANLINGIFNSIGIGSTLVDLSIANIDSRVFGLPANLQGYDIAHGGFDGLFIGWGGGNTGILPDDGSQWFGSGYIPNNNYENVNNTQIDFLIAQENNKSISNSQRISYYYQLQEYVYKEEVKIFLFQNVAPYIFNKNLQGFNKFYALTGQIPYQNLSFTNGQNHLVIDVASPWTNLNPLLADDINNNYYINQLWAGGLLKIADQSNDSTQSNYSVYGNLAYNNFTISQNQMFYNFTLKPGLRWADGTEITASDVAFTYYSILTASRRTSDYGKISYYMNNKSITVYDKYHIGFNLNNWAGPLPFADSLFTETILPNVTYSLIGNWSADGTNTGSGLNAVIYNSNGPYQLTSINVNTGTVNLTKSSWWTPSYASKFDAPAFNVSPNIPTISIQVASSAPNALDDLVSNKVDWVDTNVGLTQIYSQILNYIKNGSITEVNASTSNWQEFGLNQMSPIWGFNPNNFNPGGTSVTVVTGTTPVNKTISTISYQTTGTDQSQYSFNSTLFLEEFAPFVLAGVTVSTLGIVVAVIYAGYRRKMLKIGSNKTSFRNFLGNFKKKKDLAKPNHNIDKSLETIEKILEEEQK